MTAIGIGALWLLGASVVACSDGGSGDGPPIGGGGQSQGGSSGSNGGSGAMDGSSGSSGSNGGSGASGGSGGIADAGPDSSGSDCSGFSSKTFAELSSSEIAMMCDCVAAIYGGYGESVVCADGSVTVHAAASQAACVAEVEPVACTTAGEAITCANDSKACDLSSPACANYAECVLGDGG